MDQYVMLLTVVKKPVEGKNGALTMKKRMLCSGLFVLLFMLLSGCGAPVARQAPILYPPPPDAPKVAYIRSYQGEADFITFSIWDRLFGSPRVDLMLKPYGVSAAGETVFVADTGKGKVYIIDGAQKKVEYLQDIDRTTGRLRAPIDVAVDAGGNIYVSDARLDRIIVYDKSLKHAKTIGKKGDFENPAGLAVNNKLQRLYVVDSYGHSVSAYSLTGDRLFRFGGRGSGDGEFNFPSTIAVDRRNDNVYVVDTQNFRVQVFDKDGKFISRFGQVGDAPGDFVRPKGVGVDSEGNIYVVDAAFNNVQVFNEKGELLIAFGSGGRSAGYFGLPAGLFIDEQDRIFVVDSLNQRVQMFQFLSEKWIKGHPEEFKNYVQDTAK